MSGYKAKHKNNSGKRSIVFDIKKGYKDLPVTIQCGQCIGCKLERSRQWAMRCMHESSLYEDNAFITLTYNDKNLPADNSLNKHHFTDFMKRLRHHLKPKKIRYYMCGEYGDESDRPHYHALIFNHDFPDKIKINDNLSFSPSLEKIWTYGLASIGEVTFESAAYVARYIMKKVNGEKAEYHYHALSTETGELYPIIPEYNTMSRRPGIGKDWYEKWKTDIYPSDEIIINGKAVKPPKFYDQQLTETETLALKKQRIKAAKKWVENNTTERLIAREKVKLDQFKQLKRSL